MKNQQTKSLTDSQLWEIVGDLQIGNRVFYNKITGEIKSLIDLDSHGYVLDEIVDEWNELEAKREDYIEILNMDSTTAFSLMEDFVEEIEDTKIKNGLSNALNQRKPFASFKREVENSEEYRENWFKFRDQKMKIFVSEQVKKSEY